MDGMPNGPLLLALPSSSSPRLLPVLRSMVEPAQVVGGAVSGERPRNGARAPMSRR
ncbi:hypothetical protein X743_17805 [Mesorhizobium sp. LNHC252B00]|nr:hypothetical protein X743_17805 [Mesorhizobium sp. LNHC252B00]